MFNNMQEFRKDSTLRFAKGNLGGEPTHFFKKLIYANEQWLFPYTHPHKKSSPKCSEDKDACNLQSKQKPALPQALLKIKRD